MLYYFSAEGIERYAAYVKDNDNRKFYCSKLVVDDSVKDAKTDCVVVTITNSENKDTHKEAWVVMHGTPAEIVWRIDNEWPMAKMETDMIFDYLDTVGKDDIVTFTYLLEEPDELIQKTAMYKEARACQQLIVANMFDLKPESIQILRATAS